MSNNNTVNKSSLSHICSEKEQRKKEKYVGCLLGGAIGDALGYPVEFLGEEYIKEKYGSDGIRHLSEAGNPAVISDDTQMTLFAANAVIFSETTQTALAESLQTAYLEWFCNQSRKTPGKPVMWISENRLLQVPRAPGNTCMSACSCMKADLSVMSAANNSKGCGTVMRAAPFGLMKIRSETDESDDCLSAVIKAAAFDAGMTHGHPEARDSSAFLACLIYNLTQREKQYGTLQDAVRDIPCVRDARIEKAVALAEDTSVQDIDGIHLLGEGWTAGEALAIAVFCAVRYQNDFGSAVRAAANHKGDSDSTAAICGNILGARLGVNEVLAAFSEKDLELSAEIRQMADDLFTAAQGRIPAPGCDPEWDKKYRRR